MVEDNNSFEEKKEQESAVFYKREESRRPVSGKKSKKTKTYLYGVLTGIWISILLFGSGSVAGWLVKNYRQFAVQETAVLADGKEDAVTANTTRKMQTIENVIYQYYLEDTDAQTLENGIYAGMINSLGDPYSAYYSAEELKEMEQDV